MKAKKFVRIIDNSMRDGSHAVRHQFTLEDVTAIASALDNAGVPAVEVSHGDGLAGSTIQYGWALKSDEEKLEAASKVMKRSVLSVLLIPGVGTRQDLQKAVKYGAKISRIAVHCTEADISEQHIGMSKDMGMEAMGLLMMSHMEKPPKLIEQAKMLESYGADVVYLMDSAGAMLPDDVRARVSALKQNLKCEVGFHAHNNLGLAIGNTLAAIEEGATVTDACLCGLGGGSGNTQTEVLVAVLDKFGYETGINLYKVMDAAENVVRPRMHRPQIIDRAALALGYAGVYSSFLLHAYKAADRFKVDPLDVLKRLGEMRVVGGQEDMIVDVAYELSQKKDKK
jgi:4-hydroxy 2-oxovalerate aldolase